MPNDSDKIYIYRNLVLRQILTSLILPCSVEWKYLTIYTKGSSKNLIKNQQGWMMNVTETAVKREDNTPFHPTTRSSGLSSTGQ